MIFTRVFATLFAFGAVSALASPAPAVEKRQDVSEVLAVISTLQSTTGGILPQIGMVTARPLRALNFLTRRFFPGQF
jgi:hypothetical protein